MFNRKGNISDTFIIGIAVFSIISVLLIVGVIWNAMFAQFQATPLYSNTDSKQFLDSMNTNMSLFDMAIIVIQGFLLLLLPLSVYFIPSNPAFFAINVIILGFSLFINNIFVDIWQGFTGNPVVNATITSSFPMTNLLFDNWVSLVAIFGGLMLIFMYAKSRGDRG